MCCVDIFSSQSEKFVEMPWTNASPHCSVSYTKLFIISSSLLFKIFTVLSISIFFPIYFCSLEGVSFGVSVVLAAEQFHLTGVTVGVNNERKARGKISRCPYSTFRTSKLCFAFSFLDLDAPLIAAPPAGL